MGSLALSIIIYIFIEEMQKCKIIYEVMKNKNRNRKGKCEVEENILLYKLITMWYISLDNFFGELTLLLNMSLWQLLLTLKNIFVIIDCWTGPLYLTQYFPLSQCTSDYCHIGKTYGNKLSLNGFLHAFTKEVC